MSKAVKEMDMQALRDTFKDVRDLVVLSTKGLTCHADHHLRASLRKKQIRLRVVKNSLLRRVFSELGVNIDADSPYWRGPTMLAWGAGSIAELSRELDGELKAPKTAAQYKDRVIIKGAVADGEVITFEQATKRPTRAEAIGRIVSLALSPASRLLSQIAAPAARVAGQIKTLSEKKPEGEGTPAPEAQAPA